MNSPMFCNSPTFFNSPGSGSSILTSSSQNMSVPYYSLIDRVRTFMSNIDEAPESDLYNIFVEIIFEIFGRGPSHKGWEIDKLKTKVLNDQTYICREQDSVYNFLYSKGYIFKLCYKLLSNSLIKFDIHFSDIPIEVRQRIIKSFRKSYYGLRFFYQIDSNVPIGLQLNSFEYYMFHFALFGLKLTSENVLSLNINQNESSVYKLLCLDYLHFFLPLENSSTMIFPQLKFNVISIISNQKQFSLSKPLSFIKKDLDSNDLWNDNIGCWTISEITWRSEVVAFFFADLWLNIHASNVPSMDLTKIIRCFMKHLHLYSNRAKNLPMDNLKLILISRHGTQIYQYLAHYMINWPQDFSVRLLFENWQCYIQPWRYENINNQNLTITKNEMNEKWKLFIIRNLLCYTKLFYLAIKRFLCTDICSPRYSFMIYRMLKVFTHPYLLNIILDIEDMYLSNQSQDKKFNVLLTECLLEAENSPFKYERLFSEERMFDYKLFYSKLQKSLDHVTTEMSRYQEEKLERNKSSMFELILSPRKSTNSDYTLLEWEEISTNLKSSLILMEQVIGVTGKTSTHGVADILTWSVPGITANSSSFSNRSKSLIQSFARKSNNLSRTKIHEKEYEIDPDYLGASSYENEILVNMSKLLRQFVEFYGKSHIIKYSTENTILAGVLRQTIIRAPMMIYSYESRNDGSGKRVRTPRIVPPTISFRWLASYFTLIWILFILTFILSFNSTGFWFFMILIFRIIYLCIKYFLGHAPPFLWEDTFK